jgi:hypothetical protein
MNKLEELSLKELKEKAIALGIPEEDLKGFASRTPLIVMLRAIQNKPSEPVKTLESVESTKVREEDDRRWENKVERQRKFYDSQPKIRTLIPTEGDEKPGVVKKVDGSLNYENLVPISGAVWSKTFNGLRVVYPKGVYIDVPEEIANKIGLELNLTNHAGDQWRLDRVKPETGEQVSKQLT